MYIEMIKAVFSGFGLFTIGIIGGSLISYYIDRDEDTKMLISILGTLLFSVSIICYIISGG